MLSYTDGLQNRSDQVYCYPSIASSVRKRQLFTNMCTSLPNVFSGSPRRLTWLQSLHVGFRVVIILLRRRSIIRSSVIYCACICKPLGVHLEHISSGKACSASLYASLRWCLNEWSRFEVSGLAVLILMTAEWLADYGNNVPESFSHCLQPYVVGFERFRILCFRSQLAE